jgi:hypothetical protein
MLKNRRGSARIQSGSSSPTYTTGVERACLKDNSTFAIENASAEPPVASCLFFRYFAVVLVLTSPRLMPTTVSPVLSMLVLDLDFLLFLISFG